MGLVNGSTVLATMVDGTAVDVVAGGVVVGAWVVPDGRVVPVTGGANAGVVVDCVERVVGGVVATDVVVVEGGGGRDVVDSEVVDSGIVG